MPRLAVASIIAVLFLIALVMQPPSTHTVVAQSRRPAGTAHDGNAFRFNKVRDGVYHAIGTGALAVVGNSAVIVNDRDVIVVDDHVSPAAAWVLLDELKSITDKPVTTVINTHFHFDHAHGNQIFERDFLPFADLHPEVGPVVQAPERLGRFLRQRPFDLLERHRQRRRFVLC